jgi:hypothetical protein
MAMWHSCIAKTIQPLIPVLASVTENAKKDSDKRLILGGKQQLFCNIIMSLSTVRYWPLHWLA